MADALLRYGIDLRLVAKLREWCAKLQNVTVQKVRGEAAGKLQATIRQHDQRMEETFDEETRNGSSHALRSSFEVGSS